LAGFAPSTKEQPSIEALSDVIPLASDLPNLVFASGTAVQIGPRCQEEAQEEVAVVGEAAGEEVDHNCPGIRERSLMHVLLSCFRYV
jgi:hypothetical protein